jgi:hypothetical protein
MFRYQTFDMRGVMRGLFALYANLEQATERLLRFWGVVFYVLPFVLWRALKLRIVAMISDD